MERPKILLFEARGKTRVRTEDCSLGNKALIIILFDLIDLIISTHCSFSFASPKENEPKEKGTTAKVNQFRTATAPAAQTLIDCPHMPWGNPPAKTGHLS